MFPAFARSIASMLRSVLSTMAKLCIGSQCLSEVDEPVPSMHVMSYRNAQSFLHAVGPWLRAEEKASNTILTYAEMLETSKYDPPDALLSQAHWIVCWSLSSPHLSPPGEQAGLNAEEVVHVCLVPQLRFVVMVAESHIGPLPLFVFAPNMAGAARSNDPQMIEAMAATASTLVEIMPPQQTLSIFGPSHLVQTFAAVWDAHSVSPRHPAPPRRVRMLVYSTSHTTGISVSTSGPGDVRVARASDTAALAGLTKLLYPVSMDEIQLNLILIILVV